MQLGIVPEHLEIEVEGLRLQFLAASEQDIVFAASIIENRDITKQKPGVVDRDLVNKHVFGKLLSFSGEIMIGSESITVEKLKELASGNRIRASFTLPVTMGWAVEVLRAHGLFGSEAEEKKE